MQIIRIVTNQVIDCCAPMPYITRHTVPTSRRAMMASRKNRDAFVAHGFTAIFDYCKCLIMRESEKRVCVFRQRKMPGVAFVEIPS